MDTGERVSRRSNGEPLEGITAWTNPDATFKNSLAQVSPEDTEKSAETFLKRLTGGRCRSDRFGSNHTFEIISTQELQKRILQLGDGRFILVAFAPCRKKVSELEVQEIDELAEELRGYYDVVVVEDDYIGNASQKVESGSVDVTTIFVFGKGLSQEGTPVRRAMHLCGDCIDDQIEEAIEEQLGHERNVVRRHSLMNVSSTNGRYQMGIQGSCATDRDVQIAVEKAVGLNCDPAQWRQEVDASPVCIEGAFSAMISGFCEVP